MYDIAIIGGGPAGSMFARLIGNKYKVILIDKRDLENEAQDNSIRKCCGGLLSPDAQNVIARLGLGIPKDILVDPQLFAVRTIDINSNIERFYQRFYFNMDREKFDRWLVSIIPNSVDKKFNSLFKSVEKTLSGYNVTYIHNEKEKTVQAKIIVGADGAFSKIRRLIFEKEPFPKAYISIQEWFHDTNQIPYFTAVFDKDISDFYSWIIPKNDYLLLGAALKPKDNSRQKFESLKDKLRDYGFRFENKVRTEGAYIYRPAKIGHVIAGGENIALIGEASGAISPSSAEGFSYAFKSALYLAQSLEKGTDGFLTRYNHSMKKIKANILLKNLKSPAMYNPFLRRLAMKSGLQSMSYEKVH